MRNRMLPRDLSFFDLFDRHAARTVLGAKEFLGLVLTGADIGAKTRRIHEIEHETDQITHACVEALHRVFVTPFDRDDIHRLITRLDDVIDFVDAAAERLSLYELTTMTADARDLAAVLVRATEAVEGAVRGLRNMKDASAIRERCIEVNRLENEADAILRGAIAKLFRVERDPVTIIKWKEVYENLETATDRCEDVAVVIEGVVLENE